MVVIAIDFVTVPRAMSAAPMTIFNINSQFGPVHFQVQVIPPERIHVARVEVSLRSIYLSLTKQPFIMSVKYSPDELMFPPTQTKATPAFKIGFRDVPDSNYELTVALIETNQTCWISKSMEIALSGSDPAPHEITDFSRRTFGQ